MGLLKHSLVILTTLAFTVAACNAITGTGKYVIADCAGNHCVDAQAATGSDAGNEGA